MGMFSEILLPIDFSERSSGAARFAIPPAERFHSQVTDKCSNCKMPWGLAFQCFIESGHIPRAVSAAVARLNADLVVIGRGASTEPGRLGLNTYGIIRKSCFPVMSV